MLIDTLDAVDQLTDQGQVQIGRQVSAEQVIEIRVIENELKELYGLVTNVH